MTGASTTQSPGREVGEIGSGAHHFNEEADVRPFRIAIADAALDDLQARLDRTRYAPAVPGTDAAEYGLSVDRLRRLIDHWRTGYDCAAGRRRSTRIRSSSPRSTVSRYISCTSGRRNRTRCRCFHPRLAGQHCRVSRRHRPADRPPVARRGSRCRLRCRHPLVARLRLFRAGRRDGVGNGAERDHRNIVSWHVHDQVLGHYAAHQATQVVVDDIRGFYRALR